MPKVYQRLGPSQLETNRSHILNFAISHLFFYRRGSKVLNFSSIFDPNRLSVAFDGEQVSNTPEI